MRSPLISFSKYESAPEEGVRHQLLESAFLVVLVVLDEDTLDISWIRERDHRLAGNIQSNDVPIFV